MEKPTLRNRLDILVHLVRPTCQHIRFLRQLLERSQEFVFQWISLRIRIEGDDLWSSR